MTLPSVVAATVGRRGVVVCASPPAMAAGVRVGLSLAEARAICPPVVAIADDPAEDARALVALGRWMTRFTPIVATGWTPEPGEPPAPAAVLLLDVTGCERLFGSLDVIVRGIRRSMDHFRLPASVAVGPTPGAAWARAAFAPDLPSTPRPAPAPMPPKANRADVSRSDVNRADVIQADTRRADPARAVARRSASHAAAPDDVLGGLPIEALRLPTLVAARLRRVGIDTVGQVLAMPRDALAVRFGRSLGRRLDQLLGVVAEPLVPLAYDVPVEAAMSFDGAIDSLETLWLVMRELVGRVCLDLERRGHGARRIELACAPDPSLRRPPVTRVVHLTRASRDANAIHNLMRCAVERLDCGTGFVHVRLRVPTHEPTRDEQPALLDDANAAMNARAWEQLVERLSVRLGDDGVVRPVAVESYVPERAWRAEPIARAGNGAAATAGVRDVPRPLNLLSSPAEVRVIAEPSDDWEGRPAQFTHGGRVHRLVNVIGPERIAGEWWRGHHKTRDYYDAQDEAGRRFWLFRVIAPIAAASVDGVPRLSTRWFLHGVFVAAIGLRHP